MIKFCTYSLSSYLDLKLDMGMKQKPTEDNHIENGYRNKPQKPKSRVKVSVPCVPVRLSNSQTSCANSPVPQEGPISSVANKYKKVIEEEGNKLDVADRGLRTPSMSKVSKSVGSVSVGRSFELIFNRTEIIYLFINITVTQSV